MADQDNPMAEAEAQLYRRIQELRTRARADRAPGGADDTPTALPDLRTILARGTEGLREMGERGLRPPGEETRGRDHRSRQTCPNGQEVLEPFVDSSLSDPKPATGKAKNGSCERSALD